MEMVDDGFIRVKMYLDKRVIPSDRVNNSSMGEQRGRDNLFENEKISCGYREIHASCHQRNRNILASRAARMILKALAYS